jgi:hypothetical protein
MTRLTIAEDSGEEVIPVPDFPNFFYGGSSRGVLFAALAAKLKPHD